MSWSFRNFHHYQVYSRLADGLVTMTSSFGRQQWTRTSGFVRKNHQCQMCGRIIDKHMERMYHPLQSTGNRYHRICVPCVERLACYRGVHSW